MFGCRIPLLLSAWTQPRPVDCLISGDLRLLADVQPPPPPPGKSNVPYMLLAVGAAAGGAAYFFFGTEGSAGDSAGKADTAVRGAVAAVEKSTGMRRGIEEYQKVYNRIAEQLDVEDYDGKQPDASRADIRWIARPCPDPSCMARFRYL